jgi:pimeloyl-ACP methyl ester carboxylesterase
MKTVSRLLLFTGLLGSAAADDTTHRHPKAICEHLKKPYISGAEVISITGTKLLNHTVPASPGLLPEPVSGLDVCAVDVTLSHHGANDTVLVKVWMPLENWNGRFQANGGSGYAAGALDLTLAPTAKQGYSAASTDAGVGFNPQTPALWALRPDGSVDQDALVNFAYRSVQDVGLVGKAVTAQFYGCEPRYSYWNGCSTGGRQAMVAAQRYPDLFDGILAGAPAISWATYVIAEQWPQVVMHEENTFPSPCELKAFTDAAIAACDDLDGVLDGVINDPDLCHFDPYRLVGQDAICDVGNITITESVARAVLKMLQGPFDDAGKPLWYGLNVGAALDILANTTTTASGERTGYSFFVNDAWIRYWVAKNPNYKLQDIDYTTLEQLFVESTREYDGVIGTDNPDLSAFQGMGGKLLMWHGLSDQIIFPQGTIDYRGRVERLMGGPAKVDQFFRLFLAPGVDHCAGTPSLGAVPIDPFGALVSWVEEKKAPAHLSAEVSGRRGGARIICPYPLTSRHVGGDTNSASSFRCV